MMPRCPICGVESEHMDLHESTLHTESNQEVRAPGSIDQRDGFGMCAAPGEKDSEAIELLREWYETYGGSTLQGGKPVDKSLDERTAAVLGVDNCAKVEQQEQGLK